VFNILFLAVNNDLVNNLALQFGVDMYDLREFMRKSPLPD
jgi:hypothetical protein